MTSSMTAHVIADLVNPTYVYETFYEMLSEKLPHINWNKEYKPPHKNAMMDKLTVVYPHYFVNLEYEGVPFQFAMVNIGAKQKLFGKFENGKADPRIYKFYEDIKLGLKYLNDKKENYTSEKNKKRFNGVRKVENDEYQLYLVEKYNIKKNETLNKFVLNDKPYQDLIEVLNVAHNIEINNSDL